MKVYKGDGVLYNEHPDPLLCPFCGKEVKVIPYSMSGSRHVISHPKTERLQPGSARRWGDLPCPMESGRPVVYETKARAIEAWNIRKPMRNIEAYARIAVQEAERKCKNTLPHDWGTFECSQCGGQYSVVPVYITAGGMPNDDPDPSCVNFCPGCGAKVVS